MGDPCAGPSAEGAGRHLGASRVNEYGGGAFWAHGESLFWVEDDDQRIRRVDLGDEDGCLVDRGVGVVGGRGDGPAGSDGSDLLVEQTGPGVELVGEPPARRSTRYAAGVVEPGGAWMIVERELHVDPADVSDARLREPVNDLVWLPTGLAAGHPSSSLPSGVRSIVAGERLHGGPGAVSRWTAPGLVAVEPPRHALGLSGVVGWERGCERVGSRDRRSTQGRRWCAGQAAWR
ncbi:MAG: hypothetical protein M5U19_19120 [Microthrixaceae bacterium]|nr:hypothetical protein [Microthrixaceae bacterium]